jgi:LacI family transcriptional regulator
MARPRRIGVIIDLSWAYQHHHGVFVGVQRYARQQGWDCVTSPHADASLRFPGTRSRYDGIVARVTPELAVRAQRAKIPLVNVYFNSPVKSVATVGPDRRAVGRMAAEHLLARGFRNFGYLGFRRSRNDRGHLAGFRDVLRAAGFDCSTHLGNQSFDASHACWTKYISGVYDWIDTWRTPLAAFCSLDLVAHYLADACRRKNLNVPNDVAIVGTQNEPVLCQLAEPTLTSIDIGYEQVGYEAARLLDQIIDGAPPPAEPVLLPPLELVPRQSTDVLAVTDPLVSRAMRFIAEQGHRPIQVGDVAAAVATTRRTLQRRFRDVMGRTIAEEITRLRLERVKRLLVETDESLKSLSAASGFLDAKQLSKAFTRIEGISPTQYRRERAAK